MKTFLLVLTAFSVAAALAAAGGTAKPADRQLKTYTMDNNYFSCGAPDGWSMVREKDRDEEYEIYEIEFLAPRSARSPATIRVSYYAKDNPDFSGYEDFVESNSQNILGETKSERENYEPVKKIKLNGRKAFELSRTKMTYLNPESKSEESEQRKDKIYVLPAKEGFYVLKFSAPAAAFIKNLPVFEKIAKSFKGKP